jgi:predicted small secreted protein
LKKNISLLFIIYILLAPVLSELIGLPSLHAQTVNEKLWATNGSVNAIARSGNTIYIGGHFTYVGPPTGYGAVIDVNTGNPNLAFAKVNGSINAVVPDGAGGWFVGGTFTMVGGVARNIIAHLNANGTLSGSWSPNANNAVSALAVSGSTVYVCGKFTSIGGQTRNYVAALDATTGMATSWNPNADTAVVTLAVSDSTVYAGGDFTSIGGQTRNYIAALDTATGTATSWYPDAGGFSPNVYSLAVSGTTV